jgi:hypothetical protein
LWFPPVDVPLGLGQSGPPPVLVMVAGNQRLMTALLLPPAARSRASPRCCGHPRARVPVADDVE